VVFVACVGLGDREAELPLDPRQDGVPDPVHADLLGLDPREMFAETFPKIIVPAGADRPAARVPEQALARAESAPALAVCDEVSHQRG
jgi:hypothetical protein